MKFAISLSGHAKCALAIAMLTSLPMCAIGEESKPPKLTTPQGKTVADAEAARSAAVKNDAGVQAYRASQANEDKKRIKRDNLRFGRTVR